MEFILKQLVISITLFLFLSNINAQNIELCCSANSGLFSFAKKYAVSSTLIHYDDLSNSGYTDNPFGSKAAICYGLSFTIKEITQKNFIYGVDLAYEDLRSKVNIYKVIEYDGNQTYQYLATGHTFLNNSFVNLYLFVGHRYKLKKVSFDIAGGTDIGYNLGSYEKGSAIASNGNTYSTFAINRTTLSYIEIRPRIQISAIYKRCSLYIGYSYSVLDLLVSANSQIKLENFTKDFRFGITYNLDLLIPGPIEE